MKTAHLGIEFRVFCGVVAAHGIGLLMSMVSPFIIASLVQKSSQGGFGVSNETAGALITFNLLAVAFATYAVAPFVHRISMRKAAVVAAVLCSIANFLPLVLHPGNVLGMALTRVLSGAGSGVVFATGPATVARSRDPDRAYALVVFTGTVLSAVALAIIPYTVSWMGFRGGFLFIALNMTLMIPFLFLLPGLPAVKEVTAPGAGAEFDWYANAFGVFVILTGMLLLNGGDGQMYYYSEAIGALSGMTLKGIGMVLAAATIAGLAGGATAAMVDLRFGRSRPLITALAIKAAGCIAIVYFASAFAYTFFQCLLGFTFYLALPYILGLSARIDPKGRVAALAGGSILFGSAISAFTGGLIVQHMNLLALGLISALMMLLVFVVLVPIARRYDREDIGPGGSEELDAISTGG